MADLFKFVPSYTITQFLKAVNTFKHKPLDVDIDLLPDKRILSALHGLYSVGAQKKATESNPSSSQLCP